MFILILNPCTCPIMNVVFLHLNSHFQNVMFGIVLITSFFFYLRKGIYCITKLNYFYGFDVYGYGFAVFRAVISIFLPVLMFTYSCAKIKACKKLLSIAVNFFFYNFAVQSR